MPVDKAELAKDLANPEYQQLVAETLKESHVIRTKADNDAYEGRFKQDILEKELPGKLGEVHSRYDQDIEKATGIKKNTNEKTHEYLKRAFESYGDPSLKAKVTDLENQIKNGDHSKATAAKLEEAEKKYQAQLAERDEQIKQLQGATVATKKEAALTSAYAALKGSFVKTLPPMFDRIERAALAEILTRVGLDDDGKLYKIKADGSFEKDKSFNKIPVDAVLAEEFKDLIDKGQGKRGGAGSGGDGKKTEDPNTITADTYEVGDDVKTGEDLMTQMLKDGIKRGTQLFQEIWDKKRWDLPDAKNMKRPVKPADKK